MGYINQKKFFVNREADVKFLGLDVLKASQNTACLIHAPKGIGKTELIEQVIKLYSQKHRCITVTPEVSSRSIPGAYIQAIFRGFANQNSMEDIDSFFMAGDSDSRRFYAEFVRDTRSGPKLLFTVQNILAWSIPVWASLLGISAFTANAFFAQFGLPVFGVGIVVMALVFSLQATLRIPWICLNMISRGKRLDALKKVAETISDPAFFLQLSYVKSALQNGGYLLHLRNVQEMDPRSQRALTQCLYIGDNTLVPNYFFLEYQSGENSQVETFIEYIRQPIASTARAHPKIEEYCLSALSEEHIRELAGKLIVLDKQAEEEICLYWKERAQGNLFEIIRFINSYNAEDNLLTANNKLDQLSNQQKLVLLLFLFSSPHAIVSEIEEIADGAVPYIQAEIKVLELDGFICLEEGESWSCTSEITENWAERCKDFSTVRISAESLYVRFWWRKLRSDTDKNSSKFHNAVNNLLNFHTTFSPQGLTSLLTYLVQSASMHFDRDSLRLHFDFLLSQYKTHGSAPEQDGFAAVACCYNLEFYSLAWAFLSLIPYQSEEKMAYTTLLLHCMGQYEKAVAACQAYLLSSVSMRLRLLLKQVELISRRMLYQPDLCLELFAELKNTPQYRSYPEYGFFLRNAEILVPVDESIKYLHKSIRFFRRRCDTKNVGISLLSLGMQYARMGRYYRSILALTSAQHKLDRCKTFAKHYCFVDLAAAYLLKGRKNSRIKSLLEQAELIVQTDFDRLVILTNKVAYCILTQDYTYFDALMKVIQQDSLPNVIQVRRSLYYNVSVMYRLQGQIPREEEYLLRSKECHKQVTTTDPRLPLNSLWEARYQRSDAGLPQSLKKFYRCPYHVSFISFWHFDVPDF